jgi:ATP-dependent Clp protease ATP-binding subunit ClpB
VTLELTPEAREFVARQGYDPVYGARPLKRFLQHELETRIGRALIAGEVREGAGVRVGVGGGGVEVQLVGREIAGEAR